MMTGDPNGESIRLGCWGTNNGIKMFNDGKQEAQLPLRNKVSVMHFFVATS